MKVGILNYKCKECGKDVTLEYRPDIQDKTDLFFKSLFNKKLCSGCYEKKM